jgi:quinol-cytochrome oxidoreductase complex cytochrome b subunit
LYPPEIGRQIDFSAQYQPKPEWYFLWSYQLVRYFPGNTTFIGTVLIPSLAVLALILIPYIDRGRHGRLRASLVGMFLLLAFVLFTVIPALSQ